MTDHTEAAAGAAVPCGWPLMMVPHACLAGYGHRWLSPLLACVIAFLLLGVEHIGAARTAAQLHSHCSKAPYRFPTPTHPPGYRC